MADAPQPIEPLIDATVLTKPARRRWQVGIRTLVLLTAAFAVYLAYYLNSSENQRLEARINAMRPLAHELLIDNPKKAAVVQKEPLWYDDNEWEVYLPKGQYRLCLATRAIDREAFPPVKESAILAAGRHRIALEQERGEKTHHVFVTEGGRRLLTVEEPKAWDPSSGSEGAGGYSVSEQLAPDKPFSLFRRRFMGPRDAKGMSQTPNGPTNGIMLWIEPVPGPKSKP